MEALLTSPDGTTDLCSIMDLDDSLYDIKFKPTKEGVHTVSLKHKGMHISGKVNIYTRVHTSQGSNWGWVKLSHDWNEFVAFK